MLHMFLSKHVTLRFSLETCIYLALDISKNHVCENELTHTQSSICALPLPDILWPVGQQQGVVCPRGTRGVPSRLKALSKPSCAMDGPCPRVPRKCVAFV